MDKRYETYCLADTIFYDVSEQQRMPEPDFEPARRPVPRDWTRSELEKWIVYLPKEVRLPEQGWKIHVSAGLDNATEILETVWDYCGHRHVAFKFLRNRIALLLANAKYADRGASGKFVTIYPSCETELLRVLEELGPLLEGRAGPYILSDLRWGAGPLYVRYGGFSERRCPSASGEWELAIEDATGQLVPDRRGPTFQLPPWVELPDFLAPHLAARNGTTVADLPYRIDRALHFSNGGGLYVGEDLRNGEQIVLKEARPYAGLTLDGDDAITRLHRERDMLERLAGLDVVPALRDHFALGEHEFLVQEFVPGQVLNSLIVEHNPITGERVGSESAAEYTSWVIDVLDRVESAVAEVHDRGVVLGDVHPSNILIRPDGRPVLIDFEGAAFASEGRRQSLADPAFLAPSGRTGLDIDSYALACLRLFMFLPLTSLLGLSPGKARHLAQVASELFGVTKNYLDPAVRTVTSEVAESPAPTLEPDSAGWQRARDSMVRAILDSATPERRDRLFPGDVEQFGTGGLNLAHGAAGVLYALAMTGAGRCPEHEDWLIRRVNDLRWETTRLGLFDGLHGIAHVLQALGHRAQALKVLAVCDEELGGKWQRWGLDLQGGLSGIVLNLAHFADVSAEPGLHDTALNMADVVATRLDLDGDGPTVGEPSYAGLLRGSSGPALMFIRLYERTGDAGLLDSAAVALRRDLGRCLTRPDGSLEVNEGWRTMPYLAEGSIGIGMVLDEYLLHRADESFAEAAAAIRKAAEALFYIQPDLFGGRAGMIAYLSRGHAPGTAARRDPVVAAHIRRLAWHALDYRGHLAFPGEQLLRLSMDLATGTAGVLLAMGAALHDEPVHLPFLGPLGPKRPEHAKTRFTATTGEGR